MEELLTKPRAVLLYRASTKKQTDSENDIPLQRNILKPWVEQQGWSFHKEFVEGGISGFKVSAANRDAIIEIKKMAERREFDILAIYMSDRLGRIAEETPLIVSFLNARGIKVISYGEGEITANTHADKLMTYIRYWQAEGESLKTSMRVTDAGETSVKQGKWRGGNAPYGYRSVSRGTLNYKGKPIFDVEIHPEQAEVVKTIFRLYTEEHYGSHYIAKYLNDHGHVTRDGHLWNGSMVLKLIKNKLYIGIYELGKWTKKRPIIASPVMEHLVIIDESTFEKAQKLRQENNLNPNGNQRQTIHGEQLLTGILYCGECGKKFTSHYHHHKRQRKDGSVWEQQVFRYRCASYLTPMQRKETCHQKTYKQTVLDNLVIADAKSFIRASDRKKLLAATEEALGGQLKAVTEKLKGLTKDKVRLEKEQSKLKEAVLKSLMGEGEYSSALLNEILTAKDAELADITEKIDSAEITRADLSSQLTARKEFAINLDTWETRFDEADTQQKKAMLLNIINRIDVHLHGIVTHYSIETHGLGTLTPIDAPNWLTSAEIEQNTAHSSANSGVKGCPQATAATVSCIRSC